MLLIYVLHTILTGLLDNKNKKGHVNEKGLFIHIQIDLAVNFMYF